MSLVLYRLVHSQSVEMMFVLLWKIYGNINYINANSKCCAKLLPLLMKKKLFIALRYFNLVWEKLERNA